MTPNLTTATALFLTTNEDSYQSSGAASVATASTTLSRASLANSKPSTSKASATATDPEYRWQIVWRNVIVFLYLHVGTLYGIYLLFTAAHIYTILWTFLYVSCSAMGITAGAHRLWAHRAYKARWPLRLMLAAFQTMAFQNHIYEWVRDHRVHHKFSETDADPHNANRGFFFSHVGWLMIKKHPDVKEKGKVVDMSDLDNDPIVVWQRRTYMVMMPLLCFAVPAMVPVYCWGEKGWTSWYVAAIMRYTLMLNGTWLVNSAAHIWGNKPFDKSISPAENLSVAILAFGEGWHNFHHVFPWDYKAGELGNYRTNFTTAFIDFFARVGWAYNLKTVSDDIIRRRVARTGDGTYRAQEKDSHHHLMDGEESIWGWGDKDMPAQDIQDVLISNKKD